MKLHGNSNDSNRLHHLYELRDRIDDTALKYGISAEPIEEDGTSKRMRVQLKALNLGAGWLRYFGKVLLRGIAGRERAKEAEKEHIESYKSLFGSWPRGND